jgi:hypothetical protein
MKSEYQRRKPCKLKFLSTNEIGVTNLYTRHLRNQRGSTTTVTSTTSGKSGTAYVPFQVFNSKALPLRLDLQILSTLLKQAQNERDQLREQLDNVIENTDKHKQLLTTALQRAKDTNAEIQKEVYKARSEGEKALRESQDANAKLQETLEDIRSQIEGEQLRVQRLMNEARDQKEALRSANQHISDLKVGNSTVKRTNRQLNKQIETLTSDLNTTKSELSSRQEECKLNQLTAEEHKQLLDAYNKLVQDHEEQKSRIQAQDSLIDKGQNTISQQASTIANSRLDQACPKASATLVAKPAEPVDNISTPMNAKCEDSKAPPAQFDHLVPASMNQQPPTCSRVETCPDPPYESTHVEEEAQQHVSAPRGKASNMAKNLGRFMKSFGSNRKDRNPEEKGDMNTLPQQYTVKDQKYDAISKFQKLKSMPKNRMMHAITIFRPRRQVGQNKVDDASADSEEAQSGPRYDEKPTNDIESEIDKEENEESGQNELETQKPNDQTHENTVSRLNVHTEPCVPIATIELPFQNGKSTCPQEIQDLILKAYQSDEDLQAIFRNLALGNPVTALMKKSLGTLLNVEKLQLINGLIYHIDVYGPALYLPKNENLIHRIIQHMHESTAEGHADLKTTFECLRKQYYWPGMGGVVAAYVGACIICKGTKTSVEAVRHLSPPTPQPSYASSNTGSKRHKPSSTIITPTQPTRITSIQIAQSSSTPEPAIISQEGLTKIQHIESIIEYTFADKHLLWESLQAPNNGIKVSGSRSITRGNLRLAKVGDKVLDLMIAWKGYEDGLMMQEIVELTWDLASNAKLTQVCLEKEIHKYLNGKGKTENIKFKADSIEAIIGAVAMDCQADFRVVRRLLDVLGVLEWK